MNDKSSTGENLQCILMSCDQKKMNFADDISLKLPHKFTTPELKCAESGLLCCIALLLTIGALWADTFTRVTAVSVDACGLRIARVQAFAAFIHVCGQERRGSA